MFLVFIHLLILQLREMEISCVNLAKCLQDYQTGLTSVYTPLCQFRQQNTLHLRQASYIRDRYLCVIIQNRSRGLNYIVRNK